MRMVEYLSPPHSFGSGGLVLTRPQNRRARSVPPSLPLCLSLLRQLLIPTLSSIPCIASLLLPLLSGSGRSTRPLYGPAYTLISLLQITHTTSPMPTPVRAAARLTLSEFLPHLRALTLEDRCSSSPPHGLQPGRRRPPQLMDCLRSMFVRLFISQSPLTPQIWCSATTLILALVAPVPLAYVAGIVVSVLVLI